MAKSIAAWETMRYFIPITSGLFSNVTVFYAYSLGSAVYIPYKASDVPQLPIAC